MDVCAEGGKEGAGTVSCWGGSRHWILWGGESR